MPQADPVQTSGEIATEFIGFAKNAEKFKSMNCELG